MGQLPPTAAIRINDLGKDDILSLQRDLFRAGFPPGECDGLFGPRTLTAWHDFKASIHQDAPETLDMIGPSSYAVLKQAAKAKPLPEHDFSTQAGTMAAIRYECQSQGLDLPAQIAYVLATAQWETAGTFKPLEEYGKGRGRPYGNPDPNTGKTYYGRGFVQLTWKGNYQKYSKILNVDLVHNPELACNPNVALFVLVHGFRTGAFTGKRLTDYINSQKCDFINARRCINGLDKAQAIAAIARGYL